MTMLGVGEILGGSIVGAVRDKFGNRAAVLTCMIFMMVALGNLM
jgi:predicted MFS family arabinose efflux permease